MRNIKRLCHFGGKLLRFSGIRVTPILEWFLIKPSASCPQQPVVEGRSVKSTVPYLIQRKKYTPPAPSQQYALDEDEKHRQ